jgi:hypothetical protein
MECIMVTHKEHTHSTTAHYIVMAQISEPKYADETKFLKTEMAYVERKLIDSGSALTSWISAPSLGFYHREDWEQYAHALEKYGEKLEAYSDAVAAGELLPVKFMVFNSAKTSDTLVNVHVKVTGGKLDYAKKPPQRPTRIDGSSKFWPKLVVPGPGFSRRNVKQTAHTLSAQLSGLGAHDGATLINEIVHLHCGPDTSVHFDIHSTLVDVQTGEVELVHQHPQDQKTT